MADLKSDLSINDEPMSKAATGGSIPGVERAVDADVARVATIEGDATAKSPVAAMALHASPGHDAVAEGFESTDLLGELARVMHDAADAQFARITTEL